MTDPIDRSRALEAAETWPDHIEGRGIADRLRALPAVEITDEMCRVALDAFHDAIIEDRIDLEAMREALEAAFVPLPNPPAEEG